MTPPSTGTAIMLCRRCREAVPDDTNDLCPKCMEELGIEPDEFPATPEPPVKEPVSEAPAASEVSEPTEAEPTTSESAAENAVEDEGSEESLEIIETPLVSRSPAKPEPTSSESAADDDLGILHGAIEESAEKSQELVETPLVSHILEDQIASVPTLSAPEDADEAAPEESETPSVAESSPIPPPLDPRTASVEEPATEAPTSSTDQIESVPLPPGPPSTRTNDTWDEPRISVPTFAPPPITDQIDSVPTPPGSTPTGTPTPRPSITAPATPPPTAPSPSPPPPRKRPPWRRKKRGAKALKALLVVVTFGGAAGGGYYAGTGELPPILARVPLLSDWLPSRSEAAPEDPPRGLLIVSVEESDATLWVNNQFVSRRRLELPDGDYRLRAVAPGFKPYSATVTLSEGDTLQHRIALVPIPQCDRPLEVGYNAEQACFDVSPEQLGSERFAVPLTTALPMRPENPAILVIQVLEDGTPATVLIKDPSDVSEFATQAAEFAKTLTYEPATKDGVAVSAWVELEFHAGSLPSEQAVQDDSSSEEGASPLWNNPTY